MSNPVRNALRRIGFLFATLVALALPTIARSAEPDLSVYTYEDTRQLVTLVRDAAALMAQKGEAAFADFQVPNSRWRYGQYYVFIYAVDGTCVFHPEEPALVGKNQLGMRDIAGRQIIRGVTDVARNPEPDASGWVFYLWEDHTRLAPSWKAAYVRKVVTSDGRVYALGSGLFNPKTERLFVKDNVDRAVALLTREGKAGFEKLLDPSFALLDSYVFVMDSRARLLVDPVFPTNDPRDLWNFTDTVGVQVIQNVLRRLASEDEVWMAYLMPPPGGRTPARKLMYVRKLMLNGEALFVGSDYYLATPIWMRVENDRGWQPAPPT